METQELQDREQPGSLILFTRIESPMHFLVTDTCSSSYK